MRRWGYNKGILFPSLTIIFLSDFLLLFGACRNTATETEKYREKGEVSQFSTSEINPEFIKYRLFRNNDSTWGYTIFLNSRPYIYSGRFRNSGSGFKSKEDAAIVAGLFVKMMKKGDLSPRLNKRLIDSLKLKIQ
jgi:hypothetical protein